VLKRALAGFAVVLLMFSPILFFLPNNPKSLLMGKPYKKRIYQEEKRTYC